MPLIPSESASFPDLLGRGLGASKKSKWRIPDEIVAPVSEPQAPEAEPVPEPNTNSEAPPLAENPQPISIAPSVELTPPAPSVPQAPPPETETAPTSLPEEKKVEGSTHAPIPIVRIARSIADRAAPSTQDLPAPASTDPAQPSLAKTRLRPRPTLQPRFKTEDAAANPINLRAPASELHPDSPAPVAPQAAAPQMSPPTVAAHAEDFGFLETVAASSNLRNRRRARFWRFFVWELFALTVTIVAIVVGLVHRPPDDAMAMAARIVTIVFAIAAAAIPVVFYGLPETLPEAKR
jgi:hypothetical protein